MPKLFTWGYWGWGTATRQFVRAVDAVEAARGFEPPLFVDIRISRSVRATGFNGTAFERFLGAERYQWMPALGNRAIVEGGSQRIADPSAAADLLKLARQAGRRRRRVIFFCSCASPERCHRRRVAGLVLAAARRAGVSAEIVEWPGGKPVNKKINLSPAAARKFHSESKWIPLGNRFEVAAMAEVPWYSVAEVAASRPESNIARVFTGPAMFRRRGWWLPLIEDVPTGLNAQDIRRLAERRRLKEGRAVRRS